VTFKFTSDGLVAAWSRVDLTYSDNNKSYTLLFIIVYSFNINRAAHI